LSALLLHFSRARGRKRAQLSESIDSKTKSGGNLLRERYSRKSDRGHFGFARHTTVCARAREHPFLPSFLGARKIFSVVSSRGDATTMRSCAADNGREPPENFTRTMSPRVYHSVVYEFALVYHSTAWHFSSFHLNGWRSLTSFVDRFVRIALHYFGIESFFCRCRRNGEFTAHIYSMDTFDRTNFIHDKFQERRPPRKTITHRRNRSIERKNYLAAPSTSPSLIPNACFIQTNRRLIPSRVQKSKQTLVPLFSNCSLQIRLRDKKNS